MPGNCLEDIDPGKNERHGCEHGGGGTYILEEHGDGSTHYSVHACPRSNDGEGPKTTNGIGIIINRPSRDFCSDVVGACNSNRNKEEQYECLAEPSVNSGCHQRVNIKDIHIEVRGKKNPREPDTGTEKIPLGDVGMITTAHLEGNKHPDAWEGAPELQ